MIYIRFLALKPLKIDFDSLVQGESIKTESGNFNLDFYWTGKAMTFCVEGIIV